MRSRFDEQLDLLDKEMITMGALCENAIAMSAKAVAEGDLALTESIPALAEQIGQKEREIESLCLKLLFCEPKRKAYPALTKQNSAAENKQTLQANTIEQSCQRQTNEENSEFSLFPGE